MSGVPARRKAGKPFRARLGMWAWRYLHGLAARWPCDRCRPPFFEWMEGMHDAVNVGLGRSLARPASFARFASGALDGRYHGGCVGCRILRTGFWLIAPATRRRRTAGVSPPRNGSLDNGLRRG